MEGKQEGLGLDDGDDVEYNKLGSVYLYNHDHIYIYIDRLHWPDHQHPIIILLYNICRHRVQEPYTDQALHGLLTVRRTEELI